MEKAREVYGGGGYFEFTGFPDYKFRDDPNPAEAQAPAGARGARSSRAPPIVDVTMRLQEGRAVLRQPHHVRRQHDDARQRDPAARCGWSRTASSTPRR